jgi:DNA-binding response OmpR family regulator
MEVINEPSASGASILIVDDTPFNLRFLSDVLNRAGYITHTATDGQQAVELAQTLPLDLMLLDIMMPGLSGYEVCSHLKADEKTRDIPVIFLSALNQELDKVQAFTVGGVDYITKPFQVKEVLARIETHLTLRHLQKDLEERNLSLRQEIGERKLAEEALRRQTTELEARNAELDAFAHTVAHDLKTPLTPWLDSVICCRNAIPRCQPRKWAKCWRSFLRTGGGWRTSSTRCCCLRVCVKWTKCR